MKNVFVAAALFCVSSAALADFKLYTCTASTLRNDQGRTPVHSVLYFDLRKEASGLSLEEIVGHIQVGADAADAYYNIFNIKKLAEDTKYAPKKYKGYARFNDLNSEKSSSSSEEGMWGELVVEKTFADKISAHYILKAGDHLGGTIDYSCRAY